MKILLVNVDGRFNLAIRRMYNYFKEDHEVTIKDLGLDGYPDRKKKLLMQLDSIKFIPAIYLKLIKIDLKY